MSILRGPSSHPYKRSKNSENSDSDLNLFKLWIPNQSIFKLQAPVRYPQSILPKIM